MLMQIQHLLPHIFVCLHVVITAALIWLYRVTRLRPVLVNLVWALVSLFVGQAWLTIARPISISAETVAVVSNLLSIMSGILNTVLFVWMLVALVRWGRPDQLLSRTPASHNPAA